MKKSQISAQIFIYILAAVIIGIILLVGGKAIMTIISTAKQVNIETLKSDFGDVVSIVSKQHDSVQKFEFTLPNTYDQICMIDSMNDAGQFEYDNSPLNHFILDKVENNVPENVFLLKDNIIEVSFYVENLDILDGFVLCLPNGKITLWLKGVGKKALLYT